MRNVIADIIARLLIATGYCASVKKKALRGDYILSIYFHSPSRSLFEFCVIWLKKNGFRFLSESDIVSVANKESTFPKGGVILTVDDGWQSNNQNVIAIADKHKVPVTIFVSTDAIENGNYWWPYIEKAKKMNVPSPSIEELKKVPNKKRLQIIENIKKVVPIERQALNMEQLKKASKSRYIKISAHTVHHPILVNCEDDEAFLEIKDSKEQIEEWLGKNVDSFAYPNGDYSKREIEYLKKLKFSSAYTTEADYLTRERLEKIYELPRFCIFEGISESEAICRMMGVWQSIFGK